MNFFGHATVARTRDPHPRFVLGAMLPDLASMAELRLERVLDPQIARGVALHHETDHAFHGVAPFRALCASALDVLEAQGVARASARAVGHVGSELLLDGLLADDGPACAAYRQALRGALEGDLEQAVAWKGAAPAASLRRLVSRLLDAPLPEGYRDPIFVYERLHTILARRPRLALQAGAREPVQAWLFTAAEQLAGDVDAILEALR